MPNYYNNPYNNHSRHINSYVHDIIKLAKENNTPVSFQKINRLVGIDITTHPELYMLLSKNPRLKLEKTTIEFIPQYDVKSAEDLRALMKNTKGGIEMTKLLDSNTSVAPFIEELKEKNELFILKDLDGAEVLFYNDIYLEQLPKEILELYTEVQVPSHQDIIKELNMAGIKIEPEERKKPPVMVKQKKVKKYKRKIKITNTHVKGLNLEDCE